MDFFKLSIYDRLTMEEIKTLWSQRIEDAREILELIFKCSKFYKLNIYEFNFCAPDYAISYKRIQDLKQDLETLRK